MKRVNHEPVRYKVPLRKMPEQTEILDKPDIKVWTTSSCPSGHTEASIVNSVAD
jgi:hypothetical protein